MSIATKKRKIKSPPPPPIGYDADGRPILAGTLGRLIGRCRTLTVICPQCGRRNHHGWPADSKDNKPSHRWSHCDCYGETGYCIVPAAKLEAEIPA